MAAIKDVQAALDALTVKVNNEVTVDASIVTLVTGLSAQIKTLTAELAAAGTDSVALQAVVDGLTTLGTTVDNNAATISAAVTANTP